MKSFETAAGKRIEMFIDPKTAHIKLKFVPGGQLPDELAGLYTSTRAAEKSIAFYLSKQKQKEI